MEPSLANTIQIMQKIHTFLPSELEFLISVDGRNFKKIGSKKYELRPRSASINKSDIKFDQEMQYLMIKAKNIGICPDWHIGAGNKSWLFIDEVIFNE